MFKLFVIAKNNMKRQKGDMLTFLLLTLISGLMIFDCASAISGIDKIMDAKFEEINGAHILLYTMGSDAEKKSAQKVFEENEHIVEYEMTPMMQMVAGYRRKGERSFNSFNFFVESFDEEKTIMNISKPVAYLGRDDILVPYNMSSSYAVGDTLQLKVGDDVYDLNVAGYLEDPYFSSTMNISVYSVVMTRELMEELEDEHPKAMIVWTYVHKGQIAEGSIPTVDLEKEIEDAYKDELEKYPDDEKQNSDYTILNWDSMKGGSEFLPLVVIATVLIFAVLILVIALVIISFSIRNFIRKNMKNTGILEACGYTVAELRLALTIQISSVALVGSALGIAIGAVTFTGFGNIISIVLGLSWNQPADLAAAAYILLGMTFLIAAVSMIVSGAYNKVSVLDALRGGVSTHNFKRNFFPFEKTALPVPVVLALKDTFGGIRKNLLMSFIICLLAVSTLIGFCMYENFGVDPGKIMSIMSVEVGTAAVQEKKGIGDYEGLADDMRDVDSVESVLAYTGYELLVTSGDLDQRIYTTAYDDMKYTTATNTVEGRMPETDNEVMVTSGVAKDLDLKVGDVVSIKYDKDEADYIVVGINQSIQNMGRSMNMTLDGLKKIIPGGEVYPMYYVYAKEGVLYQQLERDLYEMADEEGYDIEVIDMQGFVSGTVDSVVLSMRALCIIIVLITVFVVVFVESLVIRAKISREWKNMGVSKALGQTTGGLMLQIMLSNMPAIVLGAVAGGLAAKDIGKAFICGMFAMFELNNLVIGLSPFWVILTVAGILAIAVITAGVEGLRVKKLIPVEMITEE